MRIEKSLFVVVALLALAGCGLADLRPDSIGDTLTPAAQARGAQALAALKAAHGGDAFCRRSSGRAVLSDDWGLMSITQPWPKKTTLMQLEWHPCNDSGRVTFLNGPARKRAIGIQNWVTYAVDANDNITWKEDADARFFVPTMVYFLELPFRIGDADTVSYAGTDTWQDRPHTLVFVSFGQVAPSKDVDQYLLYIDEQTGLLSRADYTVRDVGESMTGTAIYSHIENTDGFLVPRDVKLTVKGGTGTLHHMKIRSVSIVDNAASEARLYPDRTRKADKAGPNPSFVDDAAPAPVAGEDASDESGEISEDAGEAAGTDEPASEPSPTP